MATKKMQDGGGFQARQEKKLARAKTRAAKEEILKDMRNSRSDRAANTLSAIGSKRGPKSISTSTSDSRNSGNTTNTNSTASKSGSEAASSSQSTSRGGAGGSSNAGVSESGNSNSTNAVKTYKKGGMTKMQKGGAFDKAKMRGGVWKPAPKPKPRPKAKGSNSSSATVIGSGNSSSNNSVNVL